MRSAPPHARRWIETGAQTGELASSAYCGVRRGGEVGDARSRGAGGTLPRFSPAGAGGNGAFAGTDRELAASLMVPPDAGTAPSRFCGLPTRFRGTEVELSEFVEKVRDYNTYGQTGYLGMGVNNVILEKAMRRLEERGDGRP
jgi:hypothetical protein